MTVRKVRRMAAWRCIAIAEKFGLQADDLCAELDEGGDLPLLAASGGRP